jgi:hypothetical protein
MLKKELQIKDYFFIYKEAVAKLLTYCYALREVKKML